MEEGMGSHAVVAEGGLERRGVGPAGVATEERGAVLHLNSNN